MTESGFHIVGPPPINPENTLRYVMAVLEAVARQVRADFEGLTLYWLPENQPVWNEQGPTFIGNDLMWSFTTDSEPFTLVDLGTPPHLIEPRTAKMLVFQSGWERKTRPGSLQSFPGGRWGRFVAQEAVMHPGIEPGGFSDKVLADAAAVMAALLRLDLYL